MNPCPVHGMAKLRQGKDGGWYCSGKLPDGSWCKHKPGNGATSPAPQPWGGAVATPAASPAPAASIPLHDRRVIAAMEFSGRVYQGTGEEAKARLFAASLLSLFTSQP